MTADAARRLPRWVPWLLMIAYVLPGFVGRDPWRGDDLNAFAVMLDMAHGGPWWTPQVLGEAAKTLAWLPYWLGAWAMQALPLPGALAARVPFIALLGLTLAATWYATYRLACHPGAQPLRPAFGDDVPPGDYARALADGALLGLVATLGLARLAHEIAPSAAQLAFGAGLFYAVSLGLRAQAPQPARAAWEPLALWWLSAWGWALSGAPGLMALVSCAGLVWWRRAGVPWPRLWIAALGSIAAALAVWLLAAAAERATDLWRPYWHVWGNATAWVDGLRQLAWFWWPTAPFALWTLWRWRGRWREAHIGWPATVVALVLLVTLHDGGDERTLLHALPPLATLAAFALPTLRRGVNALIDWFAVLFFTGAAVLIWLIWVAMQTGVPPKPAANVARLVPGFEPTVEVALLLPAMAMSAAWLGVVLWRLGRHAPALWKGLVLSASGVTLNWVLLMTLWLPLLDWGLGQAPVSRRIAALIPAGDCVLVHGLDAARIAGLQYHGGLTVRRVTHPDADACRWLVANPADFPGLARAIDLAGWQLRTEVPRLRENREKWLVFERVERADAAL
ncbi:hypothetical protein Tther_00027 [Tepidimonas thermarum]|uniref:Lipid IV(A) 4-amino-4-deoxy-L-arabinosyltransferase n=1 Tax=Tepidimonas thermarum TaxID=335431 RepID=A0A554X8U8_9BURK|nr:hypothetical protein [Tepidimonas thermarum]TSE32241.1 hypothetical protein Tther_00027 [Tepidimonas thermarum]